MKPRTILIYVPTRFRERIIAPRVINSFADRVRPVLEKIDEAASFGLHYAAPLIRVFPSPDLNCHREVVSTFTDTDERQAIRIVACDVEDTFDPVIFAESKLCVTIRLKEDDHRVMPTAPGVKGCEIVCSPDDLLRVLADIQLDLAFGNSEAIKPLIKRAVDKLGWQGFYSLKAKFYRRYGSDSYLGHVDEGAGYAPISALAWEPELTNGKHRDALVEIWDRFVKEELTPYALEAPGVHIDLRGLAIFGKQLKSANLQRITAALQSGTYKLAVLRRSVGVRKSPAIRGTVKHLFGPKAAPGTFMVMEAAKEIDSRHRKSLIDDGWIAVQRFYVA